MNATSVITSLKRLFFLVLAIQLAFFVSFAFKWIDISSFASGIPIVVERYALLITLLGIPGALKLFSLIMDKSIGSDDTESLTETYKKAFIARFGILSLVASLNIILYAFSFNQNFMLLTLITFTAYIFSYPSESYLNTAKKEKENEQEE